MWYYDNYTVERKDSSLKITADAILVFDHNDNEIVHCGTPKWWDDYLTGKINLCNFNIYFLCSHTVPHGQYNRLTDYKKVWGLEGVEKGFYDNYYENNKGRVYFGIKKGDERQSLSNIESSAIILLPKEIKLDANKVFNIFKDNTFDFSENRVNEYLTLLKVNSLYGGSILLKYNSTHEVSLLIFYDKLDDWFNNDVLASHKGANETIYRRP